MKSLFRASICIMLYGLLSACQGAFQATPSPIPSAVTTSTPTVAPSPSLTATATMMTATRAYIPPTPIPTIDPTLLSDMLKNAFSVQTIEGINGHTLRQITGWKHGFGGGFLYTSCTGYIWLDANHLLLYPATGQAALSEGWTHPNINVVRQPVVIDLTTSHVWLPPVKAPDSPETCNTIERSSELGILILPEGQDGTSAVSTYTFDGRKLSSYAGGLLDVSPSGTKILLEDSTVIDLRTNKRIDLAWKLDISPEDMSFDSYWTSDETRIYRCCYYYADLRAGISYYSQRPDLQDTNNDQWEPQEWFVYRGGWIQNDTYFLPNWNWLEDGDIRSLPMLDPAKKMAVEVRGKAGIPENWSCTDIADSPDGKYLWMTGFGDGYLVDLITFKARYYPQVVDPYVYWSPNSKFALLRNRESSDERGRYSILSVIGKKELKPLPTTPWNDVHWWDPSGDKLIYAEDKNTLLLLDASSMSLRKLPFKVDAGGYDTFVWSPNGEKVVFIAEDDSLWQVDYPKLKNPEQLTPPLPKVYWLNWSPDGSSLAFISGSDIYIVDTTKK